MAKLIEDMTPDELKQYAEMLRGRSVSSPYTAPTASTMIEPVEPIEPVTFEPRPPMTRSAAESAEVLKNAPRTAAESAEVFESMPTESAEDIVKAKSIPGKTAADSAEVLKNAPRTAAESAEVLEGVDDAAINSKLKQDTYNKLFSKQAAQDIVNSKSLPGKSAAESAEVLANAPSEADALVKPMKSAADSAEVFAKHPGTAAESAAVFKEAGLVPEAEAAVTAADPTVAKLASKFPDKAGFANFLSKLKSSAPTSFEEGMNMAGKGVRSIGQGAKAIGQSSIGQEALNVLKGKGVSDAALESVANAAGKVVSPALRVAGKVAGPASLAYEALKPMPTEGSSDYQLPGVQKAIADQRIPLPNGGMTGNDLDKYIAAHPGPEATTGFNPSAVPVDKPEDGSIHVDPPVLGKSSSKVNRSPAITPNTNRKPAAEQPQFAPTPSAEDPESPAARLKAAQDRADMLTMMNQLGKSANLVGSGISGGGIVAPAKVDNSVLDSNIALAQKLPGRVAEEVKMERLDPKAAVSVSARDFIKKSLGINVPDNVSAEQLKEQFPVIEKFLQARENSKMRAQLATQHKQDMDMRHQELLANKYAGLGERQIKAIQNDPTIKRSDQRIQSLDKAMDIINSGGVLTPQLLSDVEQDIVSAASGSNTGGALGKLQRTEFHSLQLNLDKLKQFMGGKPVDIRKANPEVVQNAADVIAVMKKAYEKDRDQQMDKLIDSRTKLYEGNAAAQPLVETLNNMRSAKSQAPSTSTPGLVKIRSKKTGTTKTLDQATAAKYLGNPDFEQVQ